MQVEQGSITVASQRGKKNPLSIYQWTNAFLNFASVYLEVKSDEAPHLLKYMSTVRQINATNGDMSRLYYDENFRMLREFNSLPWQQPLGERTYGSSNNYPKIDPQQISSLKSAELPNPA